MANRTLGYKVTTRTFSWRDLALRVWNEKFYEADPGVYEFSNGRKFESTDRLTTGFYQKV